MSLIYVRWLKYGETNHPAKLLEVNYQLKGRFFRVVPEKMAIKPTFEYTIIVLIVCLYYKQWCGLTFRKFLVRGPQPTLQQEHLLLFFVGI